MEPSTNQKRLIAVLWPRIEAARVYAGLTWQDLREVAGISHRQYDKWRDRIGVPTLLELCTIACACDVSLAFFLVDVDEAKERIAWPPASLMSNSD